MACGPGEPVSSPLAEVEPQRGVFAKASAIPHRQQYVRVERFLHLLGDETNSYDLVRLNADLEAVRMVGSNRLPIALDGVGGRDFSH
jgi:hypothetical protein